MKVFILSVVLAITAIGCGASPTNSTANPKIDPTATPAIVPTADPSSGTTNLSKYAKITANSSLNDNFTPDFVADQTLPDPTNTRSYMWRPVTASINSAILTMNWNSQVNISQLSLYDNPKALQNVKKGKVEFFNDIDKNLTFIPTDFATLPDDGKTPLVVPGPGKSITGVRIFILDHVGDEAGIAEVVATGSRVNEAIKEGNVTPYCHVSKYSSVNSPIDPATDTGPYRTAKIKDEVETGSEWVSNGNGAGASIELECDRNYAITEITVVDRTGGTTRFKGGMITFEDLASQLPFSKAHDTDPSAVLAVSPAKVSNKILVSFGASDILTGTGADTGISELKIKATYTP